MRKIKLVTFCTDDFEISARLLKRTSLKNGIDLVYIKTPEDISNLIEANPNIFANKKGFGYYSWHPYVIRNLLNESDENDLIIYCDSGIKIKHNIEPLLKPFEHDNINFHFFYVGGHKSNREWTKAETLKQLNFNTEPDFNQLMGGFQIYRCCNESKLFIDVMCQKIIDPIVLFSENITDEPNPEYFKEHRHNQSLLTILTHQLLSPNTYYISNEPSQYGIVDKTLSQYNHIVIDKDY